MKTKLLSAIIVATIGMHLMSCAQSRTVTTASGYATVIAGNMQRTLPGAPHSQPRTDYTFLIKWNNKKPPQSFFWRGEDGWLSCSVALAHPVKGSKEYTYTDVRIDKIKKGDILKLTPVPGGKYRIPDEVTGEAKNRIYFKTANSKWLCLPVTLVKQADVIMP